MKVMNFGTKNLLIAALLVPWMNACADGHTDSSDHGKNHGLKPTAVKTQPSADNAQKPNRFSTGRAKAKEPGVRSSLAVAEETPSTSTVGQTADSETTQVYLARIRSLEIELEQMRAGRGIPQDTDGAVGQLREQLESARLEIDALKQRNQELVRQSEENRYRQEEVTNLRREVVRLRSLVNKSTSELDQAEAGLAGIQQGIMDIQKALMGARRELGSDPDNRQSSNDKRHSERTTGPDRDLGLRGQEIASRNSANRRHR